MERLVYVGRDQSLGYVYVKLYQGLVKAAYLYVKKSKKMEYFAVLTVRLLKTFSPGIRERLRPYVVDRVERAVKSFLREAEMEASSLAARSDRLFYALRRLYQKADGFVFEAEDVELVREFLEVVRPYVDVEALWREAALRYGISLSLDKALQYAYWS